VFTPDAPKDGACYVSPQTVEALIDRSRGAADASSDSDHTLVEGQQCSVSSFNIEQPLVSTHLLNGEVLDSSAAEDDVQAIASSWNQNRYASRLADATPIYARCAFAIQLLCAVNSRLIILQQADSEQLVPRRHLHGMRRWWRAPVMQPLPCVLSPRMHRR
jgi:hypothetical protein